VKKTTERLLRFDLPHEIGSQGSDQGSVTGETVRAKKGALEKAFPEQKEACPMGGVKS